MNTEPAPVTDPTPVAVVPPPAVTPATRGHHQFGPSRLNYIDPEVGGCPGHLNRSGTSAAAAEGSELHDVVEKVVREYVRQPRPGVSLIDFATHRRTWDDEIDEVLRFVFATVSPMLSPGVRVYLECKAQLRRDDGSEINYGYLDLFLVYPNNSARLVDYKFGMLPVHSAEENRQGWAYAAAMFQRHAVHAIEVVFIQPRLKSVSRHIFARGQAAGMITHIDRVIQQARETGLQATVDPSGAVGSMNPGAACEYCDRVSGCPAYLRKFGEVTQYLQGIPMPAQLNLDAIDTPAKAAIARHWVSFLELAVDGIKKKTLELARANQNEVVAVLPDGREIRYQLVSRAVPRVIGNPVEVAEAVKDFVTPLQILGAAELSLGKTLEILAPALRDVNPELGTKKASEEAATSILEAHGLLSQPDGRIEYLKAVASSKKPKANKQLPAAK
jgi:hypothetical protein